MNKILRNYESYRILADHTTIQFHKFTNSLGYSYWNENDNHIKNRQVKIWNSKFLHCLLFLLHFSEVLQCDIFLSRSMKTEMTLLLAIVWCEIHLILLEHQQPLIINRHIYMNIISILVYEIIFLKNIENPISIDISRHEEKFTSKWKSSKWLGD